MKAFVWQHRAGCSMPNFFDTPLDRLTSKPERKPANVSGTITGRVALPAKGWVAALRGAQNRCPRCNEAKLFLRFLKPIPLCQHCGQDWRHQCTDDFPAYLSILLTGHLMAPLIIALAKNTNLSMPALVAIILPLAMILTIGLLQPAKGAIIAVQWWFGMHGFKRERIEQAEAETTLRAKIDGSEGNHCFTPLTRPSIRAVALDDGTRFRP